MSFYRSMLAVLAAFVISGPVFADNTSMQNPSDTMNTNTAQQTSSMQTDTHKLNLNTASAKDLMHVKGINAAKARAIIAYRKKHGEFKSVDDLANVKGFKKMKTAHLQKIEAQVSVE